MIAYRDNDCFDVRTQTMIEQPYTLDELVSHLRYFWQKAEGLDYGQEHEVMRCAADEIERLRTDNIRLEAALHRIENGRCDDSQELARITLEQTMTELQDRPCKWCGAPVSLHDYQELARHCYPIQIKAKDAEIERLELEVKSWRQASDLKAAEIERLRAALKQIADGTWNKGRDRTIDYHKFARAALEQAAPPRKIGVMICPECHGEGRGFDGALCKRCKGNGQLDVVHG